MLTLFCSTVHPCPVLSRKIGLSFCLLFCFLSWKSKLCWDCLRSFFHASSMAIAVIEPCQFVLFFLFSCDSCLPQAGKAAQWLRAYVALAQDLGSVPSSCVKELTMHVTSAPASECFRLSEGTCIHMSVDKNLTIVVFQLPWPGTNG